MSATVADSEWVLLHVEAERSNFRNTRSFRRWCKTHKVHIRKDGRREWIRHCDVQAAVDALNPVSPTKPANDAVAYAVGKLMGIN